MLKNFQNLPPPPPRVMHYIIQIIDHRSSVDVLDFMSIFSFVASFFLFVAAFLSTDFAYYEPGLGQLQLDAICLWILLLFSFPCWKCFLARFSKIEQVPW